MAYAKYTFFEAATQHGFIMACVGGRVARSREFCQIIIDPSRGRVFQAFKTARPDSPYLEFVIPERETTESTKMWERRAQKAVEDAWKKYERERVAARSIRDTTAPSASPPSPSTVSSTDAPPKLASLIGPYGVAEPAQQGSGPGPSTPESSPTEPLSSKDSAPPSRKSASKSRSSSGGSKGSSTSATERAGSTPAKG
jgi:hypothetical protein